MLSREALVLASSVLVGEGSLEMSRLRITLARRDTLKWWSGSRRIMALEWPLRLGIKGCVGGRMAWAMRRCKREVLPAPDGWWLDGGEMSSRIVGDEGGSIVSSSKMLKVLLVVVSLLSLWMLLVRYVWCVVGPNCNDRNLPSNPQSSKRTQYLSRKSAAVKNETPSRSQPTSLNPST